MSNFDPVNVALIALYVVTLIANVCFAYWVQWTVARSLRRIADAVAPLPVRRRKRVTK